MKTAWLYLVYLLFPLPFTALILLSIPLPNFAKMPVKSSISWVIDKVVFAGNALLCYLNHFDSIKYCKNLSNFKQLRANTYIDNDQVFFDIVNFLFFFRNSGAPHNSYYCSFYFSRAFRSRSFRNIKIEAS